MSTNPLAPIPTLTVLIEREFGGLLKAHVIQEGQKGSNLLRYRIKDLNTAKLRIQDILNRDALQPVKIKWQGAQE